MELDSALADAQPVGDLLVGQPLGCQRQHLQLARREGVSGSRCLGSIFQAEGFTAGALRQTAEAAAAAERGNVGGKVLS
jgi:hypothetical protein